MLFFGRGQLDVAPNLVGRLIIITARAVQQTTRQMKHELSNRGVRPPHMNPPIEPEHPDCRVHGAWLAQVSKAGDRLLPKEAGGSTKISTRASAPADRLTGQEVRLAPAHVDRRSGLITKVLVGCIFAAAIAAVPSRKESRSPGRLAPACPKATSQPRPVVNRPARRLMLRLPPALLRRLPFVAGDLAVEPSEVVFPLRVVRRDGDERSRDLSPFAQFDQCFCNIAEAWMDRR
jgi:hypothetical protein